MRQKPACETIRPWLKANLGKHCTGALTGTDNRALDAAVQIINLYSYDPGPEVVEAFGLVVRRMQPSTQYLAYHAIAHVTDWSFRHELWVAAGLPEFAVGRCAYE